MRSYCVKHKKNRQNACVPGSEKYVKAKNGRMMMKCKCAECGIIKTRFVKAQEGGNLFDFLKHLNPKETYDAVKKNKVPWVVDFSKGFSLLKDAFKPNPVSTKTAKEQMAGYRRDYAKYKRNGGSKSWHNWLKDNGLIRKPTF